MSSRREPAGFTLIELLVVVVIIGILAAVALPNLAGAQDRAKNAGVASNMHTIQLAIEQYGVDFSGQYPVNLTSQVITPGGYLNGSGYPVNPYSSTFRQGGDVATVSAAIGRVVAAAGAVPTSTTYDASGATYGTLTFWGNGQQYSIQAIGKKNLSSILFANQQNY